MEAGIKLIVGDAVEVLKSMPAETFGLVLADPPYLLGRTPRVRSGHLGAMDGGRLDWAALFRELHRVMRRDSALLLFGHVSSVLRVAPMAEGAGFGYVTDIVWVKPLPVNYLQARKKPLSRHELVTVWRKGKLRYNWMEAAESGIPYSSRSKGPCSFYDVERTRRANPGKRFMTDVIEAPNKPCMPRKERTTHPTQKPLALVRRLVRAFSFPGDLVLDPFAGSGTTLVACHELGRRCVGIEVNPEYAEIIRKRIPNLICGSYEGALPTPGAAYRCG